MPEDDTDTDGDIQGVLGAELRDFQTEIRGIDHILTHSCDLISEYDGIFTAFLRPECVQHDGTHGLFGADDGIAALLEATYCLHGVVHMFPCHAVLGPQGRFVDFCRRRNGADAAQPYFVDLERIRCPECGTHIMCAPDVVQHDNKSRIRQFPVFFSRHSAKFDVQKFSILHK